MESKTKETDADLAKNYSTFAFSKKSQANLRDICLEGKAGELKLRSFCWRVLHRDGSLCSFFLE